MSQNEKAVAKVAAVVIVGFVLWWGATHYVVERPDYLDQPAKDRLDLVDDQLSDKNPPFDETLVDSRPLGDWAVNKSAAVIQLDCPSIKPDVEQELLALHASYADAAKVAAEQYFDLLVSANMIDGAAKQFDDGLYAAVDSACYHGALGISPAPPDFVKAVFDKLPPGSAARPFLAGALELVEMSVVLDPQEKVARDAFLAEFERDKARSKPISFYNWTPELQRVWRFYTFLSSEFDELGGLDIPRAVSVVLEGDPGLIEQYRAITGFYGHLTNPLICLPIDALIATDENLSALAARHGARHEAVAIFPPSTSRENELFDQLFSMGLPPGVNAMVAFIRAIRSGEVDLVPADEDGWYQWQVHALETLFLPTRGQEDEKLLLTAKYKKRLVEAFKALVTKRRETHARQFAAMQTASIDPELLPGQVRPRLRVEPCATFYLRTARAYAFLQSFLLATIGQERLDGMHGLKEGGERTVALGDELDAMRLRFYGFYLVACEDIGMKPQFLEGEAVERTAAMAAALSWLKTCASDPDLDCDTRVAVPIVVDPMRNITRLWATLGVRLAPLEASYVRAPKVRPKGEGGPWQDVESHELSDRSYVIAVDEFAEFEVRGSKTFTRTELRTICDRYDTKEEILEALVHE